MGLYHDHQVGRFAPPHPLDDVHYYIRHSRRAQARAMAAMFGALFRAIGAAAKGAVGFVRSAAYGAAKMPPQGHYRISVPARLTGCSE